MQCPRCYSENTVKSGHIRSSQRQRCKHCHYQFTSGLLLPHKKDSGYRKQALQLYLEGFSLNSIASFIRVSPATVFNWKSLWGQEIEQIRRNQSCEEMKSHELMNYIKAKENITGYRLLLIDVETDIAFICKL